MDDSDALCLLKGEKGEQRLAGIPVTGSGTRGRAEAEQGGWRGGLRTLGGGSSEDPFWNSVLEFVVFISALPKSPQEYWVQTMFLGTCVLRG